MVRSPQTCAYTGWSSFEYPVGAASLAALDDAPGTPRNAAGIAVGLGLNRAAPNGVAPTFDSDVLLSGRDLVNRALDEGTPFVPVRFFFRGYSPALLRWPMHLFAPCKRRFYFVGANVYELDLAVFLRLNLARHSYTRETVYSHCSRFRGMSAEARRAEYDKLVASMRNGFNPHFPLRVMLRRDFGLRDMLRDGHHRLLAAQEA